MPQELIQFDVRKRLTKICLILLLGIGVLWSYFAVRWYLGNTMAEYFNTDENDLDLARLARSLAPADPLTHWRLAQVSQKQLPPGQAADAIPEYEKAVSLSPNDYRLWMSLGMAWEQSGEVGRGEHALRQAVALAPSYAYPRWYLGNLLLREAEYDEAFAELRKASEADPELQSQMFNLVWEVYGDDFDSLRKAVGEEASTHAQFSLYLLKREKFAEGLRLWNTLTQEEKTANKAAGDAMVSTLIGARRFHDAMNIWNELLPKNAVLAGEGRMFDGGFEETVTYSPEVVFGWQVKPGPQMQIGIDPAVSHSGLRSLRLLFQVRAKFAYDFSATQLVPVAAGTTYDFECYVRTEKLQSGGTPLIQIVDASDGSFLAVSRSAPSGDNDWNRIELSFKTKDTTEAVMVKIIRDTCGEDATVCPIFGGVWYDDFSFKRRD
jgi:hypothetical protein